MSLDCDDCEGLVNVKVDVWQSFLASFPFFVWLGLVFLFIYSLIQIVNGLEGRFEKVAALLGIMYLAVNLTWRGLQPKVVVRKEVRA